jgi:uncharacterized protein
MKSVADAGVTSALPRPRGFHAMSKPVGPICNIDCTYCFYLEKEQLYPDTRKWRMPSDVLETYVRQYIQSQDAPEVTFAWQGGEPTLLGVGFFRRVVELQQEFAAGKTIYNAIQTNGTLLDDEWGQFLAEQKFLVGLSIDGPRHLHDHYRVDKQGRGTFDAVMRGLAVLKKYHVEFNTLTVVNRVNGDRPLEVYRFLRDIGSGFIQFIPLVERAAGTATTGVPLTINGRAAAHLLAGPPEPAMGNATAGATGDDASVTEWSVGSSQYGQFLCAIFDEWVRRDVGRTFVQMFDVALGQWMGMPAGLCVFAETCGSAIAVEHNGDAYSCDHYVYPQYRLGNLMQTDLGQMVASPQQVKFGLDKRDALPRYCRSCDVRFACHGECPKHRFAITPDGEAGLNYLCPSYKRFFHHVDPYMRVMADLLAHGQPATRVIEWIHHRDRAAAAAAAQASGRGGTPTARQKPGRNDPCPCGSGRKFKKCCGG